MRKGRRHTPLMQNLGQAVSLARYFFTEFSGKVTKVRAMKSEKPDTLRPLLVVFIGILANIRHGILTDEDTRRLRSLSRPLHYPDGIEPSQLFPLRREVEVCNNSRLEALTGPKQIYQAMHGAGFDVYGMPIPTRSAEALLERLVAPPVISIKVRYCGLVFLSLTVRCHNFSQIGAQVILIQVGIQVDIFGHTSTSHCFCYL
ncbi:hypothetical protein B0H34DRAFT_683116 [Crassisporium funariophilum]|nr:hypothetical protein B0H34DRAFT_683116 [Crassisporium funariophilum]